jgi:hypothetical protein
MVTASWTKPGAPAFVVSISDTRSTGEQEDC